MTVLVTGGAGYIGSHMVHAPLDAGERVVVLDNLATGFDWAVVQGALLVIGDAGNPQLVATLIAKHRVEAIIHFAASVVDHDRDHAARRCRRPRAAPPDPGLFEGRRCRPARPDRPVDQEGYPPHQGLGRSRAWSAAKSGCLWHRLPDTGWHLHPRLHSRVRSRTRAFRCA